MPEDISIMFQQDHNFYKPLGWNKTQKDCLVKAMCKSLGAFVIPSMKALVRALLFYP